MTARGMLAQWLQDSYVTQASLAAALGCTRKHVWCIVHGRSGVSMAMARRLEEVTGISAQEWIRDSGEHEFAR